MDKVIKKNYTSIPHLSTSKLLDQADKRISNSLEKYLVEKKIQKNDEVIISEKSDGANTGIVRNFLILVLL